MPLQVPSLAVITAGFKEMGDPVLAARISRITLTGTVSFPEGGDRLPVEEIATWPDRYELRIRAGVAEPPLIAFAGKELSVKLPAAWPPSFDPTLEFVHMRLRSLFVMRHMAAALANGAVPAPTTFPNDGVAAIGASDEFGSFRIVWGGVAGGMQGVEDGAARVYFPAFFRAGGWFLPEMQSYEEGGKLLAVLDVTSIETAPGGS